MSRLTFRQFQKINAARSKVAFPACKEGKIADWSNAMAGEMGEICGAVKGTDCLCHYCTKDIGKEIADVVTYAFLLADYLGMDMETILRQKFNEVSDRKNAPHKL